MYNFQVKKTKINLITRLTHKINENQGSANLQEFSLKLKHYLKKNQGTYA